MDSSKLDPLIQLAQKNYLGVEDLRHLGLFSNDSLIQVVNELALKFIKKNTKILDLIDELRLTTNI